MKFEPKTWKNQVKKKLNEYKRVLQISSKPDREEYLMSAKVTVAGVILIGGIGFLFYMASNLIPNYL